MTRQHLIAIFFILLLLFILYNIVLILSPFAPCLFWSAVLALGFYPVYEKFLKSLGQRKNAAAGIVTLLIFLIFAPLTLLITVRLAKETVNLYQWISASIQNGQVAALIDQLRQLPWVRRLEGLELVDWETVRHSFEEWLLNSAGVVGNFALKHAATLTKNFLETILNFFLTFFLIFFFLRDGRAIYRFIFEITPLEEENKKAVFQQITTTFTAVMYGQLLTSILQGIIAGIIFLALGLPLPFFLAVVTFFTSLIPVLGAAAIWVPFTVYLFLIQETTKAVILLVLGVFVISMADNFLKPLLIGEKVKLPYLFLFLGILGGLKLYGFMGIFIAPAVLSLFFTLTQIYKEKFLTDTPSG